MPCRLCVTVSDFKPLITRTLFPYKGPSTTFFEIVWEPGSVYCVSLLIRVFSLSTSPYKAFGSVYALCLIDPPFFKLLWVFSTQPKNSVIWIGVSNECPRPVVKVWYSYDPPFVCYEVFFFSSPSCLTETISILWVRGLRMPRSGYFRFDTISEIPKQMLDVLSSEFPTAKLSNFFSRSDFRRLRSACAEGETKTKSFH